MGRQATPPIGAAPRADGVGSTPVHGDKLAILLWSVDTDRPDLAAAPFVYAAAAAALDCEVEVHFAGRASRLLVTGVAAGLRTGQGDKTLYAFMQDAAALGVRFLGCSMSMAEHLTADDVCIPEYAGVAGATAFVARTLDPHWRTLVF